MTAAGPAPTSLAVSLDGISFHWLGQTSAWAGLGRLPGTALCGSGAGRFSRPLRRRGDPAEDTEERLGVALSFDLVAGTGSRSTSRGASRRTRGVAALRRRRSTVGGASRGSTTSTRARRLARAAVEPRPVGNRCRPAGVRIATRGGRMKKSVRGSSARRGRAGRSGSGQGRLHGHRRAQLDTEAGAAGRPAVGRHDSRAPARRHADAGREARGPDPQCRGRALPLQGGEDVGRRLVPRTGCFPAAGEYRLAVYDGFPFARYHANCARVHNFKSVLIEPV